MNNEMHNDMTKPQSSSFLNLRHFGFLCVPVILAALICCLAPAGAFAQTLGTQAITVGSAAGTSSVLLNYPGSSWGATANASWLHVSSGSGAGLGNALIVFTYDALATPGKRSGTLTIAGRTLTVTQVGTNWTAVAPVTTLVSSGVDSAIGNAVDSAGNVYFVDRGNNMVKKWTAVGGAVTTVVSGLSSPFDVAVDGAGNLFIANTGGNTIEKWNAATQTSSTLLSVSQPFGVSLDASGNLYIASMNAILKWTAANQSVSSLFTSPAPYGVAVDVNGNVYVSTLTSQIQKWDVLTQTTSTLVSELGNGIRVDGSGDVYYSTATDLKKYSAGTGLVTVVAPAGFTTATGVSIDTAGNVYVCDLTTNALKKVNVALQGLAPSVTVGSAAGGVNATVLYLPLNSTAPWTASTVTPWLHVTAPGTGIGQQPFAYTFDANVGGPRVGTITLNSGLALTVNQSDMLSQTVTIAPVADQPFGASPTITASASSGLAVTLTSGAPGVCSIAGNVVTILTTGVCTINGDQAGNGSFLPATTAVLNFNVVPAPQSITFAALPTATFGIPPAALAATASSGFAVAFDSVTPAICTVAGTTITLVAAGNCTIQATQAGDVNYAAASPVNRTFVVALSAQEISFDPLTDRVFGSGSFAVSATSNSTLTVSFASQSSDICTVTGTTVALVGVGTCTIQAQQPGNANYTAAAPVSRTFQVTKADQTINFNPVSDKQLSTTPVQLTATATSGLPVSFTSTNPAVCTVAGNLVTLVSAGVCTIQASQAGNKNYNAATASGEGTLSVSFQVTPGANVIAFGQIFNRPFGSPAFNVAATATSGMAVSFATTTPAVCGVAGNTVTILLGGTCTVEATQAGNANFLAAAPVDQTFQVTPATQTIAFTAIPNQAFGAVPFAATATATSALVVTFTSSTPLVCTVAGNTVTLVAGGVCTIQADQAGDGVSWAAAVPVARTFNVGGSSQTITFGVLTDQVFGTAPLTLTATSNSALTVGFTSLTTAVCTVSGTTLTLAAAGTCTVQATQPGNASYSAATPVARSFVITPAPDSITFGPLSTRILGTPAGFTTFAVSATSLSGLPVSFTSTTASVCSAAGTTVTLVTAGTCSLTAFIGSHPNYQQAAQVSQSFAVTAGTQAITFPALPNVPALGGPLAVNATSSAGLVVAFSTLTPAICVASGPTGNVIQLNAVGTCTVQAMQAGNANWQAATSVTQSFQVLTIPTVGTPGLRFVPVTPCRVLDTRGAPGAFGGPALVANASRDFVIANSTCGIPANATAFSVNVTVVPIASLGFVTVWPAGLSRPSVSTLNSPDGRAKANAAIVASGNGGAISVFATDATQLVLDINGYFVPANGNQNLAFYPVTPCRVADTRGPAGTFGSPALVAGATPRNFPITQSACGIPSTAQAYSLNMTALPTAGVLGYLATWPTGGVQPTVSTLNAPTGVITANAAIVPAGTNGSISVVVTNPANLVIDINGYFAPPGNAGALNFYTMAPCRLADTRVPNTNQYGPSDNSGYFGAPPMAAGTSRAFPVPYDTCPIPTTAVAYSINATVLPVAQTTVGGLVTKLGYLTVWGPGSQPSVSNLNSPDGAIASNAAIVQAGYPNGQLQAFVTDPTHLIIDVTGYFAQ